jgi:ribonucleoside-diphosphate reductase alpha chain
MGIHEWLMAKGYSYGMNSELERWLAVYEIESNTAAHVGANSLSCSVPKGVRAIAPTGTIGILAGTTTGIEPLYAVAYKRRVLTRGTEWVEKYVIDDAARVLIDDKGVDPDSIETSLDLARDPERRIKFQYEVQKYVDHAISSTINLPQWGSDHNNPDTVGQMAGLLAKYAHGLRGFTAYPDAARGGQPLTAVSYWDALEHNANVETHDICEIGSKGGVCGA